MVFRVDCKLLRFYVEDQWPFILMDKVFLERRWNAIGKGLNGTEDQSGSDDLFTGKEGDGI